MNAMSYYYTKFLKKNIHKCPIHKCPIHKCPIHKCPIHKFMNDFFEFYYGYVQFWIYS